MHNFCGWVSGKIKKKLDVQGLGFEHNTTENLKSDAVKKPLVSHQTAYLARPSNQIPKGLFQQTPLSSKI